MLKVKTYSSNGTKKDDFVLPKEFEVKSNDYSVAQAVRVYEDRTHKGLRKVKTRSEVSISKRKIYKQKGTGGARHGAKSAPIFVGGGVTHGPKGVKRILTISKNIRKNSLYSVLSSKIRNGEAVVVEGIKNISKTKDAQKLVNKILSDLKAESRNSTILVALSGKDNRVYLSFRNLKNVDVVLFKNLNTLEIVNHRFLVLDGSAFEKEKDEGKEVKEAKTVKKVNKVSKRKGKK